MIDRKTIVEAYGDRIKDIVISDFGLVMQNGGKSALCPFHSEKTPSFTYNEKDYTWHCFGCGANVDIVNHYVDNKGLSYIETIKELSEELRLDPNLDDNSQIKRIEKQEFKKPVIKTKEIDEQIINHFKGRGLTEQTLKHWRIKQAINDFKINETFEKRKCIVFDYYDEYDDLTHAAYRTADKHFAQSKDTKAILWGLWQVKPEGTLYITEGQIDAMTLWQCGFKNVVSVPSGSSNTKYLEYNYDYLTKFDELVFWIDNDEAGRRAGERFKSKLPDARIIFHKECKDANEVLNKLGCEEIKRFLTQSPPLPQGIKSINDAYYNTEEAAEEDRIETGFKEFDRHVSDWRTGQLTVVFGRDNEGKSTAMSQIITHQFKRNVKTFLYSAELGDQSVQDWLYRQLIGEGKECYIKAKGKYEEQFYLKPEVLEAIRQYTKDKLYIIDKTNDEIVEDNEVLFKRMGYLASKFGVKLFILDNLQSVMVQTHSDLNRDQSMFMEKCRRFAQNYKTHVIVVAHPHKVDELVATEETKVGNLTKDSISGSKDISNKAHNVISIERDFTGTQFDMIITNLKDKHKGIRAGFKFRFDGLTNRFYSNETPLQPNKDLLKLIPKKLKYYNDTEQTFKSGEFDDDMLFDEATT
jgi:twinkle protein